MRFEAFQTVRMASEFLQRESAEGVLFGDETVLVRDHQTIQVLEKAFGNTSDRLSNSFSIPLATILERLAARHPEDEKLSRLLLRAGVIAVVNDQYIPQTSGDLLTFRAPEQVTSFVHDQQLQEWKEKDSLRAVTLQLWEDLDPEMRQEFLDLFLERHQNELSEQTRELLTHDPNNEALQSLLAPQVAHQGQSEASTRSLQQISFASTDQVAVLGNFFQEFFAYSTDTCQRGFLNPEVEPVSVQSTPSSARADSDILE